MSRKDLNELGLSDAGTLDGALRVFSDGMGPACGYGFAVGASVALSFAVGAAKSDGFDALVRLRNTYEANVEEKIAGLFAEALAKGLIVR